jgi:hypothetical protein
LVDYEKSMKTKGIAALAVVGLVAAIAAAPARAQEVTVFPAAPTALANCYPFGFVNDPTDPGNNWLPYMAFVYKNVPAFELTPGEALAFDLNAVNDVDIQLEIAMAASTANGSDAAAQPFQTVVTNTQTPANPRGDTTIGNFELRFAAEAGFSFPGGGLIIRFTNPSASYQLDDTCTETLTGAQSNDASGFFVKRGFTDADGQAPWDEQTIESIGSFQIGSPAPPPSPQPEPPPTTKADGTLTIDANKGKVEKGRKVLLSGQLDIAANESCEPNRPIQIQRRLKSEDDSKFATFATVSTDATGNYTLKAKVKKTYFYRAVVAENESCDDETSNSQKVRVQKRNAAQEA